MKVWGIVGPRGSEIFETADLGPWEWARCHKDGCEHFVCIRLSNLFCWKHADSLPSGAEFIEGFKVTEPAR